MKTTTFFILMLMLIALPVSAQSDPTTITITETARLGRGTIQELDWRPDGEMLAVGSSSGVWLFDADFEQISHFEVGYVRDVEWDHSGTRLAISTGQGSVMVWAVSQDGVNYETIFSMLYPDARHGLDQIDVSWSPDGERIGSASYENQWGYVADLQSGDVLYKLDGVEKVEFSPNGDVIAGILTDQANVNLWNVETGELIRKLFGVYEKRQNVQFLMFMPDGTQLVGWGAYDVHIWDVQAGMLINDPVGNLETWFPTAKLSPDGEYMAYTASGISSDHIGAGIWGVQSQPSIEPPMMDNSAIDVAWFPDSRALTVGSETGKLHHWHLDEQQVATYDLFTASLAINAWSPDGSMFASASRGIDMPIWVWDVENLVGDHYQTSLIFMESDISQLAWANDSRNLISISNANRIWIVTYFAYQWDVETGEKESIISAYDQDVPPPSVGWSSDFNHYGFSWGSPSVRIESVSTHTLDLILETSGEVVAQIIWSPEDDRITTLSGSYDGKDIVVEIWDLDTGERLSSAAFEGHEIYRWWGAFEWSSDGESVSIVVPDAENLNHTLHVINVETGDVRFEQTFEANRVESSWGVENRLAVINRQDERETVTILDGDSVTTITTIEDETITGMAWHPEWGILAVTNGESISFYNGADGEPLFSTDFEGRINDTSWSPDGNRLALYGVDERIHLWDVGME